MSYLPNDIRTYDINILIVFHQNQSTSSTKRGLRITEANKEQSAEKEKKNYFSNKSYQSEWTKVQSQWEVKIVTPINDTLIDTLTRTWL